MNDNFSVGNVLSKSFAIYLKNFIAFTLINILFLLPIIAYCIYFLSDMSRFISRQDEFIMVTTLGGLVLPMIATIAITYGVVQEMRGQHPSIADCISTGFSRFLPTLGTAFLFGLILVIGFILLIIPGLYFMTVYWIVIPVAVLEGISGGSALSRAKELTEGNRGSIFAVIFILGVISNIGDKIIESMFFDQTSLQGILSSFETFMYASLVMSAIVSALSATTVAVGYCLLRQEKEGSSAEELASIFE